MKYTNLFLISFFLVLGCAVKSKKDVDPIRIQQDSSFQDFFIKFGRDSLFQISRIQFPLKYSYFEGYNDSLMVDRIGVKDWNYIDFRDDSLAYKNNEDAYQIYFIEKGPNRVEYLRKGVDNGIDMNYTFERIVSQWFLVEIVDRSS
jgi:hypothetical protein